MILGPMLWARMFIVPIIAARIMNIDLLIQDDFKNEQ
jgi:hypothetical protein